MVINILNEPFAHTCTFGGHYQRTSLQYVEGKHHISRHLNRYAGIKMHIRLAVGVLDIYC